MTRILIWDTLLLHLPPRALSWEGSLFQRQYEGFQKVDLHFATKEERGFIELSTIQVQGQNLKACHHCEFTVLPLANSLSPGDSVQVIFSFKLLLPVEDWLGSYNDNNTIRIIDWLPAFPTLDSNHFHAYPVTAERDVFPSQNHYHIKLSLPARMVVASNARLISPAELGRIKKLRSTPFLNLSADTSHKTLHYRHFGTNLQFIASADFNVFPLSGGGNLYFRRDDPFVASIIDTVNGRINYFMKKEWGLVMANDYDLVLLNKKNTEYQSDHLLTLAYPGDAFQLACQLAQARFEMLYRYRLHPDGFQHVWLARGLPYYYKYAFIDDQYPEEYWSPFQSIATGSFWQPLVHSVSGWLLGLNDFSYSYQNQYLYLFLARQGLDQKMNAPADSLTRLNYRAVAQAKSYLTLHHLRHYW
ncbi:MAG: hypothetical protein U5L96_06360 [Owenweeksia sp.]|nr:hypothetical protein [Owenweeksia sp.]